MNNPVIEYEALLEEVIHSSKDKIFEEPGFSKKLSTAINNLIVHHFDVLINLLYRMDVNETELKEMLQQHEAEEAADIIASLIIERQQQKIKTREMFKVQTDIPEEEKW